MGSIATKRYSLPLWPVRICSCMTTPFHVWNSILPRKLFIAASLLSICRIRILIGTMSRIGCSSGHCAKSGCMNRLGLNALSRSDAVRRSRMMRLVGTSREDYDCGKYGDLFHFISLGMFGRVAFRCQPFSGSISFLSITTRVFFA